VVEVHRAGRQLPSFNGDVQRDLVFRRADESFAIFLLNGFSFLAAQVAGQIGDNFKIIGVGDFNGDGKSDFVIRRATDGVVGIVLMDGLNIVTAQQVGAIGTEWQFVGTGDFNADGRSDLLFFRRSDNQVAMYLMNGVTVQAAQLAFALAPGFEVVGIGDFNGDLAARHRDSSPVGRKRRSAPHVRVHGDDAERPCVIPPDQTLAGVGDISGDGISDLVFRSGDGRLWLYLIGGFRRPCSCQACSATSASSGRSWESATSTATAGRTWRSAAPTGPC
jgi:sRNA-binding regulator protein Hfq